jgi:hypothetical protein
MEERYIQVAAWLTAGQSRDDIINRITNDWHIGLRMAQVYIREAQDRLRRQHEEDSPGFRHALAALQRDQLYARAGKFLDDHADLNPREFTAMLSFMLRALDSRERAANQSQRIAAQNDRAVNRADLEAARATFKDLKKHAAAFSPSPPLGERAGVRGSNRPRPASTAEGRGASVSPFPPPKKAAAKEANRPQRELPYDPPVRTGRDFFLAEFRRQRRLAQDDPQKEQRFAQWVLDHDQDLKESRERAEKAQTPEEHYAIAADLFRISPLDPNPAQDFVMTKVTRDSVAAEQPTEGDSRPRPSHPKPSADILRNQQALMAAAQCAPPTAVLQILPNPLPPQHKSLDDIINDLKENDFAHCAAHCANTPQSQDHKPVLAATVREREA